jgi:hypothetical protein
MLVIVAVYVYSSIHCRLVYVAIRDVMLVIFVVYVYSSVHMN